MNIGSRLDLLLVEDNPADSRLLSLLLGEQNLNDVQVVVRESLAETLETLDPEKPGFDVILLDLSLPDCSGLDTLSAVHGTAPEIPILILTGLEDEELALTAMHKGAQDYLVKGREDGLEIIRAVRYAIERNEAELERQEHERGMHAVLIETVRAISVAFEKRDPYTAGHQHRVGILARAIGAEMGLDERQQEGLYLGGLIHDIGKIALPADLLSRPGALSDIEIQLLKTHPQIGYDIIKDVDFPWPIAEMVGEHHERLDGSGYPRGLSEGEIAPEARILSVADVVEAISSHRPYRPALGIDEALAEIERGKGTIFDERAVTACLHLFRDKGFAFEKVEQESLGRPLGPIGARVLH